MAVPASNSSDKFNVVAVHGAFASCLLDDHDIDMDYYLAGYKEIYKFLDLLGTVFGFVGSDVKAKIEIMDGFRKGSDKDKFTTFKTMIKYESDAGLLRKSGYVSGSRTLLRLHRGLDFIRLFLQRVGELENSVKTATVCQDAYNETLAQFHPWIIRKGAIVAMYALPTREALLHKVCGESDEEIQAAMIFLPKMLDVTEHAYKRTNMLYDEFKLHDLP